MSVISTSNQFQVYENQHLPYELWSEILSEVASLSTRLVCKQFRDVTDDILKRKTIKYVRQLGLYPKFDAGYSTVKLYMILINHIKDRAFNLGIATDDEFQIDELLNDCEDARVFHEKRYLECGHLRISYQNRLWHIPCTTSKITQFVVKLDGHFLSELHPDIFSFQIIELSLKRNRFHRFPNFIIDHTRLVKLDLSNNYLTTIPSSISRLRCLSILCLSSNQLQEIPESINQFKFLSQLDLSNNCLSTISLPRFLRELNISGNRLETLPPDIKSMAELRLLYVSHNRIKSIESDSLLISSLEVLNLSHNFLTEAPRLLENLRFLDVSHNRLTTLPEIKISLDKASRRQLNASHNLIENIPPLKLARFDIVDLSYNKLQRVWIEHPYISMNLSNNPLIDFWSNMFTVSKISHTPYKTECKKPYYIQVLKHISLIYFFRSIYAKTIQINRL